MDKGRDGMRMAAGMEWNDLDSFVPHLPLAPILPGCPKTAICFVTA